MNLPIEPIFIYIFAFILGSIFGSFACCQAWRIHAKTENKELGSRSVCMSCNKKLKWYDNIPIISWLILRGKCRNCKEKIGVLEIFSEISLGLVFLGISAFFEITFWPILAIAAMIYWILLIYDAKWGELPVFLMLLALFPAILFQIFSSLDFLGIGLSVAFLAGIYYLLFFFSKEKLVGSGDWILCLSIAIFLGNFSFALIELFLANFLATLYAAPMTIIKKTHKLSFGPFLIISLFIILFFKDWINTYILFF